MTIDTDVIGASDALLGKRILFGITGGIAAVEAVRVGRELRRHGASLHVMMTEAATAVISPLALEWATQAEVDVGWRGSMPQLGGFDGILIAPATRNTIAKHLGGIIDSPLSMALSTARSKGTPSLFVPSMHDDLFDDPVTSSALEALAAEGSHHLASDSEEGRRKQPSAETIVARLCNVVNATEKGRRRIVVTLGGNRAPIDRVREIRNASTGRTGWMIADHLHRSGHDVTCIAGTIDVLPDHDDLTIIEARTHEEMARAIGSAAVTKADGWVLAAAVLDYAPLGTEGKMPSGEEGVSIDLLPKDRLIDGIAKSHPHAIRIGFKLEVGITDGELIERAREQLTRTGNHAVIANHAEAVRGEGARAILVTDSDATALADESTLCRAIESILVATH